MLKNISPEPEGEKIEGVPEREIERPEVPKKPEQPVERKAIRPEEAAPAAPAPAPAPASSPEELKKIKGLSQPSQLKMLVEIAFDKGIHQAVYLARSLDNAYLLDEFHDAVIDELRERLVEAGKLKKL